MKDKGGGLKSHESPQASRQSLCGLNTRECRANFSIHAGPNLAKVIVANVLTEAGGAVAILAAGVRDVIRMHAAIRFPGHVSDGDASFSDGTSMPSVQQGERFAACADTSGTRQGHALNVEYAPAERPDRFIECCHGCHE
ncbi:MAG: hypothetical protein ACO1NO_01300 [Burkholderiaceae bacterium]